MANKEHVDLLTQGLDMWNQWRQSGPEISPDLSGAKLTKAELSRFNLSRANLNGADLFWANLYRTDLSYANLSQANLQGANLYRTTLEGANLDGAVLTYAILNETNLKKATLTNCKIYGISVWDVHLDNSSQNNLIITRPGEPTISVDNLEVGQFIYLLLKNEKIRDVLNAVTTKAVLILGRFTEGRIGILDGIRNALRDRGYLPIIFDFEGPESRSMTETVTTLARLSRFIIADISSPRSVPQELYAIVPHLTSVPIKPIINIAETAYGMFPEMRVYPWVLDVCRYKNLDDLLARLDTDIITPAENRAEELISARRLC